MKKYILVLLLLTCGNLLISMGSVVQPRTDTWQYANHVFKFKCVDSAHDEDIVEVPGSLVHYSKSLTAMIDNVKDMSAIIPLFNITQAEFNTIIQALAILDNSKKQYKDLINYFNSLDKTALLKSVLNINFLDIQPLLLPATSILQQSLVQSSTDIFTWKLGLPEDILAMLKKIGLHTINNQLVMCNAIVNQLPQSFVSIALNDNGTLLAAAEWDKTISIMPTSDLEEKITLLGHTDLVSALTFSPDSQTLASLSIADKTIRLWNIATKQEIAQLNGYKQQGSTMHFSFDNNYFVCLDNPEDTSGQDKNYVLINRKTGTRHILTGLHGIMYDVAISPDGKYIALANENTYVWNTQTQELKKIEVGNVTPKVKVAFSPDSSLLVCCSAQTELSTAEIAVWNMVEMRTNTPLSTILTGTPPTIIAFSKDSTLLAFDDRETVLIWDIQKDNPITRVDSHTEYVHSIDFTPDNTYMVSTSQDSVIRILDIPQQQERQLTSESKDIIDSAYVLDNTTLLSISTNGSLYTWDIATGHAKKRLDMPDATGIHTISPDKTCVALNTNRGAINIFTIKTGEMRVLMQGMDSIITMEFSNNSQDLLATYANGTALVWNIQTGIAQKIAGTKNKIITHAYNVGDSTVVFAQEKTKNHINLYDIQQNVTYPLTNEDTDITGLAFIPNSRLLVAHSTSGMVTIWDVATQQITKRLWIPHSELFTISPDGTVLAISDEKQTYLINLTTDRQEILPTLLNPEYFISKMQFARSGDVLGILQKEISSSSIDLWDMNTHMLKKTITIPDTLITDYSFIPNTHLLIILSDKQVFLWNTITNQAISSYDLQNPVISINTDGSKIIMSGMNQQIQETKIFTLNQQLLNASKELSFEQVTILNRAFHAMQGGTLFDLSNSQKLLAIFNEIDPVYRDILKQCFNIKTK
jgi:WD40 repeat protein